MIAPLLTVALAVVAALDSGPVTTQPGTNEWREYFLILATGRAPYRPLYAEADRALAASDSIVFKKMADFLDPSSTREWMALQRASAAAEAMAVPGLASALASAPNDTARWPIIMALGSTADSAAVDPIVAHARSTDRRMRIAVAIALGDLSHSAGSSALITLTSDGDTSVRRIAADGLGRILEKNPNLEAAMRARILDALAAIELDRDPWVRRNARRAATH